MKFGVRAIKLVFVVALFSDLCLVFFAMINFAGVTINVPKIRYIKSRNSNMTILSKVKG